MKQWSWILLLLAGCAGLDGKQTQQEGPAPVDVVFQGAESLSRRNMMRAIALDLQDLAAANLNPAHGDDAAFALEEAYRSNGYSQAQVDFEINRGEADSPTQLILTVHEGLRCLVSGVIVTGNADALPRDQIAMSLVGPNTGSLGVGPPIFIRARVHGAVGQLRREYLVRGYRDVLIDTPRIQFNPANTEAEIHIHIDQGPRYILGDLLPKDSLTAAMIPGWKSLQESFARDPKGGEQPRPFASHLTVSLRGNILQRLAQVGYPDAKVVINAQEPRGEQRIDLLVQTVPGPRVHIAGVRFEGDPKSSPAFLASRSLLKKGDWANRDLLRQSSARLYKTGFYSRVDPRLEGKGADRELVFDLQRRATREVWVEPGYGSYELFRIKAGARDRNFLGIGQTLRAEVTAAVRAQRAAIGLTDPWFAKEELILDTTLEYENREQPSFTNEQFGLSTMLTREWDSHGRSASMGGYQIQLERALDIKVGDGAPTNLNLDPKATVASLLMGHRIEMRDSPLLPTSGWSGQTSVEWADPSIGSELAFSRLLISGNRVFELRDGTRLVGAVHTGVTQPTGTVELPLQERFFTGGDNSVRAFQEDMLGPTDNQGNPVGGESFSTVNLELRQDLGSPRLHLALFADAGAVNLDASEWLNPSDPRWGVGIGLRYMLPLGPLRLDLGFNPEARDREDDWVLHISLGVPF
jgi:outer membrane protein assembly complex protein YaeT